jgi:hypothetical protein
VLARWKTLTDATEQAQLHSVIDATGNAELQLELWRTRLARAKEPGEKKASARQVLALRLNGEWSAERRPSALAVLSDDRADARRGRRRRQPHQTRGPRSTCVSRSSPGTTRDWAVDRRVEHELAATPT